MLVVGPRRSGRSTTLLSRWLVHQSEGPALGIIEDAEFVEVRGRLDRGDAVLLYTDGMVETRGRDIQSGIDRMLGQSDRLLQQGF